MREAEIIESLTVNLKPVHPVRSSTVRSVSWYVFALTFSVCSVLAWGPLRTGAGRDLQSPQYLIEFLAAVLTPLVAAYGALQLSCLRYTRTIKIWTIMPLVMWFSMILFSFFSPAATVSWEGWRLGCEREILLISIVPSAALLLMVRGGYVIEKKWTAMLIGLAASAAPASLMQAACMYQPWHALVFHFLPVTLTACLFYRFGDSILSEKMPG